MKLSTKLIASFSGVIILLLMIGLTSQYFNQTVKNKVIEQSRGAVRELEVSGEMESYLHQSYNDAQYFLNAPKAVKNSDILRDSLLRSENIKRNVRIAMQGLTLKFRLTERLLDRRPPLGLASHQQNDSTLVKLKQGVMLYYSLMNQLLNTSDTNLSAARHLLLVTIEPHFNNNLLPLVDQLRKQIRVNLNTQVEQLNNRLVRYSRILLAVTFLAFILSLIMAYLLYRSITKPIYSLVEATEEIGSGNLHKRTNIKTSDELGQLGESFNKMAANLNEITFSKEYVDDIIGSMRDALIVTDKTDVITKVNSSATEMFDFSRHELLGKLMNDIVYGNQDDLLLNEYRSFDNYETQFCDRTGREFPVSLSKAILNDGTGRIQSFVYVASDITERKKSEQIIKDSLKEKETLLAEIHHRVKNNLAVISGLLQMQRWDTENKEARQALQDSQLRVKSIALVHEKLYQSEHLSNIEFDRYAHELIREINKTFESSETNITYNIEIAPIALNIKQAIPCSLLLNELVVNVHKHAFNDRQQGKVEINLWQENNNVHLVVKDNGVGLEQLPDECSNSSLGMSLVDTLVKQLEGELTVKNENGACFDVIFNLD